MTAIRVDLFSDTMTRPGPEMRRAMAEAEVGDEQRGEDPTVNALQEAVATLLGKEAALFLPSGTMCNEIALAVLCGAGDEVILDEQAHPLIAEAGGPAVVSRASLRPIRTPRGVFTAAEMAAMIRPPLRHAPRTRLVSVEQTSNFGGGTCWPIATIAAVCDLARERGLYAHCDGARLLNAVVATGVSAAEHGRHFDSIWIDFSKGLGAPVGAALAGSADFVDAAWRWKQRLGGAMRQAGIIAAGALYALGHNVDRLAEDHARARRLAEAIAGLPGLSLDPAAVETNILIFDVAPSGMTAAAVADRALESHGVRLCPIGPTLVRAVTHLDVDDAGVGAAIAALRESLGG
ncbi:MAG TPA: GntG family PLP-dependent aldolase [Candidatus Dormibacteraeota bacterium]|jgi:threonine aldolase|nr:GntG family PLP-dependent aldolase [Candidatus Dormibacteraeota bacterium]